MRIAIVYESEIARHNLEQGLLRQGESELVWCIKQPSQVREALQRASVDVILMELTHAAEKLRQLQGQPLPPCLLVNDKHRGNQAEVFESLRLGAKDVINAEGLYVDSSDHFDPENALENRLITLARLLGLKRNSPRRTSSSVRNPEQKAVLKTPGRIKNFTLVLIGCSTGGPAALEEIFRNVPVSQRLAVVVGQHLDDIFVENLVSWLNDKVPMKVICAEEGGEPVPGELHVAHTDRHLQFTKNGTYHYTKEPASYSYRPSVNLLFESAVSLLYDRMEAILMTGMGKDGAKGLLALRSAGFQTIAQDQKTCAVYGMPGAAVMLDAVDGVLPLDLIGERLCRLALGTESVNKIVNIPANSDRLKSGLSGQSGKRFSRDTM